MKFKYKSKPYRIIRFLQRHFVWSVEEVIASWKLLSGNRRGFYILGLLKSPLCGRGRFQRCYCSFCDKLTKSKRGEWDDKLHSWGRGGYWTLCVECGSKRYALSEYDCPRCEAPNYDDEWDVDEEGKGVRPGNMLDITEPVYNMGKAMEFGGNPVDWDETWWCPICYNVWSCSNSNC